MPKMSKINKSDCMMPITFERAIIFTESVFEKLDEKEKKKRK